MWIAIAEIGKFLADVRDLLEVILGSLISIAVSQYYFRRQLRLELMIRFSKLVTTRKRYLLSTLKLRERDTFPDYVKDAIVEYKGYFDVYLPEGDVEREYRYAGELAQKEILEHPEKYERISRSDARKEAEKVSE